MTEDDLLSSTLHSKVCEKHNRKLVRIIYAQAWDCPDCLSEERDELIHAIEVHNSSNSERRPIDSKLYQTVGLE